MIAWFFGQWIGAAFATRWPEGIVKMSNGVMDHQPRFRDGQASTVPSATFGWAQPQQSMYLGSTHK